MTDSYSLKQYKIQQGGLGSFNLSTNELTVRDDPLFLLMITKRFKFS